MKISFLYVYNHAIWAILSPVIKKLENVDFSHCAILIETEDGISDIYESTWPKGIKTPFSQWPDHYEVIHKITFEVPEDKRQSVIKFLDATTYFKYSVLQLVTIALGAFSIDLANKFKNWTWNGMTEQICTELHARFIDQFSWYKFEESFDYVGCDEVYKAVQKLKFHELEDKSFWKKDI